MKKNLALFVVVVLLILATIGGIAGILQLDISENTEANFPGNEQFEKIKPLIEKGKRTVVFSIGIDREKDTPYTIGMRADSLAGIIEQEAGDLVGDLQYRSDIDPDSFGLFLFEHIYLFLDSSDYRDLSEKTGAIDTIMAANKALLFAPEGLMAKDWIMRDPLHLINYAFDKLKSGIATDKFIENEGLFVSDDGNHLFLYATLRYNPGKSAINAKLAEQLDRVKKEWNRSHPDNPMDFFGTFLIADANASQIQRDIQLTVTIAVIAILALLLYYYRSVLILPFFLIPGAFGVLFAFGFIGFFQGNISAIALSASAVVMGIVVDYSFHFFSQFKTNNDPFETRKQIWLPLSVSGITTIVAFMSLMWAGSKVLHDFGLFTALSLTGALLFVLGALPYLLAPFARRMRFRENNLDRFFEKHDPADFKGSNRLFLIIVLATIVLFYFARDISFESNINNLNYYPEELKKRETGHQNIDPDKDKRVSFLIHGSNPEETAAKNFDLYRKLQSVRDSFRLRSINSAGYLLLPGSVQEEKIGLWNAFWKQHREDVEKRLAAAADSLGFRVAAFAPFFRLIRQNPEKVDMYGFIGKSKTLSMFLLPDTMGNGPALVTGVVLPKDEYDAFKTRFRNNPDGKLVDSASVMEMLVEQVKDDFNYLLLFAGILVLVVMLLVYGSFELTLISFLPMAVSWIWILGLSVLFGFKFNFVNIIIATFIFGLGDDFAIFITDGLQNRFKYGRKVLNHYRTAIILSSVTTIIGTGVLFFAKHPAIRSIAGISVTGIASIVLISFAVQPKLFHFFTTRRTSVGKPPVTLRTIFLSVTGYTVFILGSLSTVLIGFVVRILPGMSIEKKKLIVHRMLSWFSGFQLDFLFTTTKRYYDLDNLDFSKPAIIIANHSSFFDILGILRLHPKIVMVVNQWVFKSPLFGPAIRFADFVPAFKSMDDNLERVQDLIDRGYSIAIFPEGRRSPDARLRRFHKGAFYLSEKLGLDIIPILLHGFGYTMPKYDYNLKDSFLSTKVLPRISPDDPRFGKDYSQRTKKISRYFKDEYAKFAEQCEALDYQYYPLLYNYKYKGPVLEWYFRIKWRYEKLHYEQFYRLIGKQRKRIYDLGCGYGFLSYYLKQRYEGFEITGIDYDCDKVAVAQNGYLKSDGIEFVCADIVSVTPGSADAVILADTLHYLPEIEQQQVLDNCHNGLNAGGLLLIRDGLSDLEGHEWTRKSEKWSTQWLKFNKTKGRLHFFSSGFIRNWAEAHGYTLRIERHSEQSSNVLMILEKPA